MKRLFALIIALAVVFQASALCALAEDEIFLDFEDDSHLDSFTLWDDTDASSVTISDGGVNGGSCLKFVSERHASKSWIPASITYAFENPKASGTQVVELYIKIPADEQGNSAAKHVVNVCNSNGVQSSGSELNFEMTNGKAKQIITRSSGKSSPEIAVYDNEWHKYTFVMNINSRTITYYQDDIEKASTEFRRENGTQPLDGFLNTFDITTNDGAYVRTIYIDNFKVSDSYTQSEVGGETETEPENDNTFIDFETDSWMELFETANITSASGDVVETISDPTVSESKFLRIASERTSGKDPTVTYTVPDELQNTTGELVIEFDAMWPAEKEGIEQSNVPQIMLNTYNSDNLSELSMAMKRDFFDQHITRSGSTTTSRLTPINYENEWHKYTFVMNLDERKITYYQDDTELGKTEFRRDSSQAGKAIKTIALIASVKNAKRALYIDNFKISDTYTPIDDGGDDDGDGGDGGNTGGDEENDVTFIDFEDDSWKNSIVYSNIDSASEGKVETVNDELSKDGAYLRFVSGKTSGTDPTLTYVIPTDKQKSEGNVVIEFDAMWPAEKEGIEQSNVPQLVLNTYNSDNLSELSMAMKRNFFAQHITRNGSTTTSRLSPINYENEWHKYTFVMSLDERIITYYQDDVKLGKTEFRRDSSYAGKKITSIAFVSTIKEAKRALYIDNFRLSDSYVPASDEEEPGEDTTELLNEGFDSGKLPSGFTVTGGNVSIEEKEEFGGNVLKIAKHNDASKETELKFGFSAQSKVALEFDVMLATNNAKLKTSFDLISAESISGTSWGMSLSLTGSALNNKTLVNSTTEETALPGVAVETNTKYNFKFIADTKNGAERGSFDYYVDGKLIGTANLRLESVPCFKTLVIKMPAGAGAEDFLYIDNLKITAIKVPKIGAIDFVSADEAALGELTENVPYNAKGIDFSMKLMENAYITGKFDGIKLYVNDEEKPIEVSFDAENSKLKVRFNENLGYEKKCKLVISGITDNLKSVMPEKNIEFKTEEPPVKYIVKFFDENYLPITSLPENGGKVNISVSIKNNTKENFTGAVICSTYSDGELISITQKISETKGLQIGSTAFETVIPSDGENYIGIYYWNNCMEMVRNSDSVFLGK